MAPAERLREPDLVRSDFVVGSDTLDSGTRSKTGPEPAGSVFGLASAICLFARSAIEVALDHVLTEESP